MTPDVQVDSWLITGGTGSFGQAFVRYLLNLPRPPKRICIFSRDELKQAHMAEAFADKRLRFFLGDVRDRDRLEQAMQSVDVVVHAAALKRVDSIAYNPGEVKRTNVDGTENVCLAAIAAGVGRVVTISSDKAVHPTTSYGASKQMAEQLTIGANVYGYPQGTRLSCVRYGNVLGSRGSVLHLFRELAEANAVASAESIDVQALIPITDERMTRFWITFPQACKLVMTAVQEMQGGEIFIPRLRAMLIVDLAKAVAPGAGFSLVGLRAGGEKLHEVMICEEEAARVRVRTDHYLIVPNPHSWTEYRHHAWDGLAVDDGFRYASDTAHRLSIEQLQLMLEETP